MQEYTNEMLENDGIMVWLTVSRWRATFRVKAKNLGLPPIFSDKSGQLKLAPSTLVPKDALAPHSKFESRGRARMDRYSFPCYSGSGIRFLPNGVITSCLGDLEALKDQFWASVDEFLDDYVEIHRPAGLAIWENTLDELRQQALAHDSRVDLSGFDKVFQAVEAALPESAGVLRGKFAWNFRVCSIIPAGAGDDLNVANAEEWSEVKAARAQVAEQSAADFRTETASILDSCMNSMKQDLVDAFNAANASMQSCTIGLNEKTLTALRTKIDLADKMNLRGSEELRTQLQDFRTMFLSTDAGTYRTRPADMRDLSQAIKGMATSLRETITEATEADFGVSHRQVDLD